MELPGATEADDFGSAFLSALRPGTHVRARCGVTNTRLRADLGISMPDGPCMLAVAGIARRWEEGRAEPLFLLDRFFLDRRFGGVPTVSAEGREGKSEGSERKDHPIRRRSGSGTFRTGR